ncbi:MAG: hypothetical protein JO197_03090 [Acidobacteria bacterium]|nr:hypothetical protein [Acidobacteriota bacterium]MBV9476632.1 hypothetical protein [Acidobacteriota bacterium]
MRATNIIRVAALLLLAAALSSNAQTNTQTNVCANNVVQNGDIVNATLPSSGSDINATNVPPWKPAYGSPQLDTSQGCHDKNSITMWGNQAVGEAVMQSVAFQAGKTYQIEFCAKYRDNKVGYANVQFRASNGSLTNPSCPAGTCEVIGTTPNLTANWDTYRFCWTPKRDYDTLTINTTNGINADDGNKVSWSNVDDICIIVIPAATITGPATSCTGTATYCSNPANPNYTWTVQNGTIVGPATGACVMVHWNAPAGGHVHADLPPLSCQPPLDLTVRDCPHPICCRDNNVRVQFGDPAARAGNVYTITPIITAGSATTVKATILSATRSYSLAACGAAAPVDVYAAAAQPPAPAGWIGPALPVTNSSQLIWDAAGPSAPVSGSFPFDVQLPPVTGGRFCNEKITICVLFEVTSPDCRTCSVTSCFTIARRAVINYESIEVPKHN